MNKKRVSAGAGDQRSGGAMVLAIFLGLLGVLTIWTGTAEQIRAEPLLLVLVLFLGCLELASAVGLWRMTMWGWYLAVVILATVFIGWGLVQIAGGAITYLLLVALGGLGVYWLLGNRQRFTR